MFNSAPFNTTPYNQAPSTTPDTVELLITQVSEQAIGTAEMLIEQVSYSVDIAELAIEQISEQTSLAAELDIIQVSYAYGNVELSIRQTSTNTTDNFYDAEGWSLTVEIDGVDYSDFLTGEWSVDAEEGLSKIAQFKLMPWTTGIDVLEYVRKPVRLFFNYHYTGGQSPVAYEIFSGKILEPSYDVVNRLITMKCSDMLQESMNQLTITELISEVGGTYSESLYGDDRSGWEVAQALMMSQSGSYDYDGGGNGHFSVWNNRTATLHAFTAADVIQGSARLDLANSRNLYSKTEINLGYRFTRKRYRSYYYTWTMQPPVGCDFLNNPFQLPQRSMIQAACEGSSWTLEGLSFIPLPKPQAFECQKSGSDYILPWGYLIINNSLVPDPDIEVLCQGFHAKFSKRWAQTVTENYSIEITATNTSIGTVNTIDTGLETKFEEDDFESSDESDRHFSSAVDSATGDKIKDIDDETDIDRTAVNEAIESIKNIEKGKLLNAYRENYVSFDVLLNPTIERHHRGSLALSNLEAEGKIYQIVHSGNIADGSAKTEVTLSLFRTGATSSESEGGEVASGNTEKPDSDIIPSTQNPWIRFSAGDSGTHIGGSVASPPFSESWTGYMTNYGFDEFNDQPFNPDAPTAEMYPVKFVLPTPAIETELRQSIDVDAQAQTIDMVIPTDKLIYS